MSCIEILQKQTPEKIQTEGGDAPVLDPPLAIYPNISHDQA